MFAGCQLSFVAQSKLSPEFADFLTKLSPRDDPDLICDSLLIHTSSVDQGEHTWTAPGLISASQRSLVGVVQLDQRHLFGFLKIDFFQGRKTESDLIL